MSVDETWLWDVAWSPAGTRVATAGPGHTVRIWDAANGHVLLTLNGHTENVESVAWSPVGDRLASSDFGSAIRIWNSTTGDVIRTIDSGIQEPLSIAWSPDGSKIAAGSVNDVIGVWDVNTGARICLLSGHTLPVISVAWSPDSTRLVSAGDDGTTRIWNIASGEIEAAWRWGKSIEPAQLAPGAMFAGQEISVAWSPTGVIAAGGDDGEVRFFTPNTDDHIAPIVVDSHSVVSVAWSPGGDRLATSSADGTVRIWNAHTGALIKAIRAAYRQSVYSLTWSPDGRHLASLSYGDVQIWNTLQP